MTGAEASFETWNVRNDYLDNHCWHAMHETRWCRYISRVKGWGQHFLGSHCRLVVSLEYIQHFKQIELSGHSVTLVICYRWVFMTSNLTSWLTFSDISLYDHYLHILLGADKMWGFFWENVHRTPLKLILRLDATQRWWLLVLAVKVTLVTLLS